MLKCSQRKGCSKISNLYVFVYNDMIKNIKCSYITLTIKFPAKEFGSNIHEKTLKKTLWKIIRGNIKKI